MEYTDNWIDLLLFNLPKYVCSIYNNVNYLIVFENICFLDIYGPMRREMFILIGLWSYKRDIIVL